MFLNYFFLCVCVCSLLINNYCCYWYIVVIIIIINMIMLYHFYARRDFLPEGMTNPRANTFVLTWIIMDNVIIIETHIYRNLNFFKILKISTTGIDYFFCIWQNLSKLELSLSIFKTCLPRASLIGIFKTKMCLPNTILSLISMQSLFTPIGLKPLMMEILSEGIICPAVNTSVLTWMIFDMVKIINELFI